MVAGEHAVISGHVEAGRRDQGAEAPPLAAGPVQPAPAAHRRGLVIDISRCLDLPRQRPHQPRVGPHQPRRICILRRLAARTQPRVFIASQLLVQRHPRVVHGPRHRRPWPRQPACRHHQHHHRERCRSSGHRPTLPAPPRPCPARARSDRGRCECQLDLRGSPAARGHAHRAGEHLDPSSHEPVFHAVASQDTIPSNAPHSPVPRRPASPRPHAPRWL